MFNQQLRLLYIEQQVHTEGFISRNTLVEDLKISKPQATIDLRKYREAAPDNLNYDVSSKRYTKSKLFKPVILNQIESHHILAIFRLKNYLFKN